MASTKKTTLVLLLFVGVLVLGGSALFVLLGGGPDEPEPVAVPTRDDPVPAARPAELGPSAIGERAPTGPAPDSGTTSVAWPVVVSLELVRAAHMPNAPDAPPIGTGRRSQVSGVILDPRGNGVPAEITFTSGANKGRVLRANGEGQFGATDLYPGLDLVEVRGPGIPGSVREVRLRQDKTEQLNISYALPGSVVGTVYDAEGEPLEGVEVMLDGQRNVTNADGDFHYTSITAGLNLSLLLRKEGYAHFGGTVAIPAARHVEKGRYKFAMDRSSTLRISIPDRIGGPDPTMVVILPSNMRVARTYPWHLVNPVEIEPGGSVLLDNLPSTKVILRAFHEGAVAAPQQRAVTLRPSGEPHVELRLQPAPSVRGEVVDREGNTIPGARVTIEAPDRVAATSRHLGEMPIFLESEVIPTLPPAAQSTVTDDRGAFVFSAWDELSPVRYVVAETADGSLWGSAVVRAPEGDAPGQPVRVVVAPVTGGRAELRVDFPGRIQGVPVEVFVEGAPREPVLVPVHDVLHVEGLAEGTWRMRVSWHGEQVYGRDGYDEFDLGPGGELRKVQLPQGAIDGQDEDTLRRAGKL